MNVTPTAIADVLRIEPKVNRDLRGTFMDTWRADAFHELGITAVFTQDCQVFSVHNVVRGLHYQNPGAQGKLVRVVAGEIFDVAVDLRRASPTFGRWVAERLSAENRRMLWIPPGFAHGYLVLSASSEVAYKVSGAYLPQHEHAIRWDDAELAIAWPLDGAPVLSAKDAAGARFADSETFA